MDFSTKETLKGIAIIVGVPCIIFGAAIGMQEYSQRDKFKAGDCVEIVHKNEFKRHAYYYKILKVGKKMYLVNKKSEKGKHFFVSNEVESKRYLNDHDKVDEKLCIAKVYEWQ